MTEEQPRFGSTREEFEESVEEFFGEPQPITYIGGEEPSTTPTTEEPWKPDFNKPNPYEGAPPEYFEREAESFVPTSEITKPPSQRFFEESPQYTPPDYIAPPPKTIDIGTATGQPISVYHTTEIRQLQRDDPYLYDILVTQGREAFEEAVGQRAGAIAFAQKEEVERFKDTHTQLPDDNWILNTDLEKVQVELPEYYELLTTQGFDAANSYIEEQLTLYEQNQQAIEKLKPYTQDDMVDVMAFLEDYPDDASTLKDAGIDPEVVDEYQRRIDLSGTIGTSEKLALLGVIVPEMREKYEAQREEFEKLSPNEQAYKAAQVLNKWLETDVKLGTTKMPQGIENVVEYARTSTQNLLDELPAPVREPLTFAGSAVYGALIMAPAYQAAFGSQLLRTIWEADKVSHLKDLGTGIADYFVREIPTRFAIAPAMTVGELTGMFLIGHERALSWIKSGGLRLSPTYIPKRGIAIEYSVARVPTKVANPKLVTQAVNNAITKMMREGTPDAIVKVGDGRVNLKLRSTPISEVIGPAFYHVTPELAKSLEAGKVTQTLFVSPQAAFRFADATASGITGGKPAVLMIFTKDGKVKWSVTNNLFRGTKEIEATYAPITLERVKNLQSRLLLGKTGEFVTIHQGKIVPIFRFTESGAPVPRMSLAELAAIRVRTVKATLADLIKGKKGYEILGKENIEQLARRIEEDANRMADERGLGIEEAVDLVTRREIERVYRINPAEFERIFRINPARFEQLYRKHLSLNTNRAYLDDFLYGGEKAVAYAEIVRELEREERLPIEESSRVIERRKTPRIDGREISEVLVPEREVGVTEEVTIREPTEFLPEEFPPDREPPVEEPPVEEPPVRFPPEEPPPREPPRIPPEEVPPPEKPTIITSEFEPEPEKVTLPQGIIAWRQGFVWWAIYPPYKSKRDIKCLRKAPQGATIVKGPGSAYKSIQALGGDANIVLTIDMGIFDVQINRPSRAGKTGSIKYRRDTKERTTQPLSVAGVKAE